MPLSDTLHDTTGGLPFEPASQVENLAKLGSAFVGGIVGGYSTAIGRAVAFECPFDV